MDPARAADSFNTDRPRLVREAARLLGPAEAEDAVQDAYVRALTTDVAAVDVLPAWLLTVVRHGAIDRWRRRRGLQHLLSVADARADADIAAPSAEDEAVLAGDVARALRLLATHASPAEGAALLLHAVFDVDHADLARAAGGCSDAVSRQRLRRTLLRLRQAAAGSPRRSGSDLAPGEDAALRLYAQALRLRDPGALWAILAQPATRASAAPRPTPVDARLRPPSVACPSLVPTLRSAVCGLVQAGGELGLAVRFDGVVLCVLPLGVLAARHAAVASASLLPA